MPLGEASSLSIGDLGGVAQCSSLGMLQQSSFVFCLGKSLTFAWTALSGFQSTGNVFFCAPNFCLDRPFGFSVHRGAHFCLSRPFRFSAQRALFVFFCILFCCCFFVLAMLTQQGSTVLGMKRRRALSLLSSPKMHSFAYAFKRCGKLFFQEFVSSYYHQGTI